MRTLGVLLVSTLLLLAPTTVMAEPESGAPDATGAVDCTVDATLSCAQQPGADAASAVTDGAPAADAAAATSDVSADTAPAPVAAPVTRTLPPPTVIQSPFVPAAAVQSAPAEPVQPLPPRPPQHLPPGPPSRWP